MPSASSLYLRSDSESWTGIGSGWVTGIWNVRRASGNRALSSGGASGSCLVRTPSGSSDTGKLGCNPGRIKK